MYESKRTDRSFVLSQPGGVRKPVIGKTKPLAAKWKKQLFTWQRREQRLAHPADR
jgi:hypothetical protein